MLTVLRASGVARDCGGSGIIGSGPNPENRMDFDKLTAEQRLVAEQAVLTFQALERAARDAPHGHGMECVEQALHDRGFDHLRQMLRLAISAHAGAQKGGPAVYPAPAGTTCRSADAGTRRC